jgi:hypothetical protein
MVASVDRKSAELEVSCAVPTDRMPSTAGQEGPSTAFPHDFASANPPWRCNKHGRGSGTWSRRALESHEIREASGNFGLALSGSCRGSRTCLLT